jgi:anti-sigma-K factor RskA
MTHEELEDSVPLYAVGALEKTERQALEAHLLSGCAACHAALKDYQHVAAILPFGLLPQAPPKALRAKIMASRNRAADPVPEPSRQQAAPTLEPGEWINNIFLPLTPLRSMPVRFAAGFAALVILVATAFVGWGLWTRASHDHETIARLQTTLDKELGQAAGLRRTVERNEKELAQLREELQQRTGDLGELRDALVRREAELEDLRAQSAEREKDILVARKGRPQQDELARLLKAPEAKVVSLAGSDVAKGAGAFLLYDPATQKIWLYAVHLPECPTGSVYQLWAIDQKPVSVGTFHIDAGQTAYLLTKRLPDFAHAKKFAVSLELGGGRPQPTGAIYLAGSL